jgi:hypothetical protein
LFVVSSLFVVCLLRRTATSFRKSLALPAFQFLFASATPGPQNSVTAIDRIYVRKFCGNSKSPDAPNKKYLRGEILRGKEFAANHTPHRAAQIQ